MPELPDVEDFRRVIADHAAGHEIRSVTVPDPTRLAGPTTLTGIPTTGW